MSTLTSDLPTLLGVTTGIAVLAGLICLVLHLFSKNKYPRHRHFNDAHLPPPIMYSSDTGTTHAAGHRLSDQTSFVWELKKKIEKIEILSKNKTKSKKKHSNFSCDNDHIHVFNYMSIELIKWTQRKIEKLLRTNRKKHEHLYYTVQSVRPSSRSSIRSSTSIDSFGHRRPSSAPHTSSSKGVLVSTSRSGAARSAAILLISSHISAAHKTNRSDDNMTKHLQQQLKHQRQMLHLELPPSTSRILSKLLNRGYENCDDELNNGTIDNGSFEMGALPSPASKTAKVVVKIIINKQKTKK